MVESDSKKNNSKNKEGTACFSVCPEYSFRYRPRCPHFYTIDTGSVDTSVVEGDS
jgi:hypothetical protein